MRATLAQRLIPLEWPRHSKALREQAEMVFKVISESYFEIPTRSAFCLVFVISNRLSLSLLRMYLSRLNRLDIRRVDISHHVTEELIGRPDRRVGEHYHFHVLGQEISEALLDVTTAVFP